MQQNKKIKENKYKTKYKMINELKNRAGNRQRPHDMILSRYLSDDTIISRFCNMLRIVTSYTAIFFFYPFPMQIIFQKVKLCHHHLFRLIRSSFQPIRLTSIIFYCIFLLLAPSSGLKNQLIIIILPQKVVCILKIYYEFM